MPCYFSVSLVGASMSSTWFFGYLPSDQSLVVSTCTAVVVTHPATILMDMLDLCVTYLMIRWVFLRSFGNLPAPMHIFRFTTTV